MLIAYSFLNFYAKDYESLAYDILDFSWKSPGPLWFEFEKKMFYLEI